MLFKPTSIVDCHVITAKKQRQVDINNDQENTRRVSYEYDVINLVYVDKTFIYLNLDYKKHGTYRKTEIFTNVNI